MFILTRIMMRCTISSVSCTKIRCLGLKPVKHACQVGLMPRHSMATKSLSITLRVREAAGVLSYDAVLLQNGEQVKLCSV